MPPPLTTAPSGPPEPQRKRRVMHPAVKAASRRLKRKHVSSRVLAPLVNGSMNGKQMFKELEKAAQQHGLNRQLIPPTTAAIEDILAILTLDLILHLNSSFSTIILYSASSHYSINYFTDKQQV